MANTIYTQFLADLANGTEDFDDSSASYKVLLLGATSTYTPDKDDKTVDDVLGTGKGGVEFSGGSYARQALGTRSVTAVDASDLVKLDAADVTFSALDTDTIKAIIVYFDPAGTDTDTTNRLVCCIDDSTTLGASGKATNGGDVTIQINASGLLTLAQSAA